MIRKSVIERRMYMVPVCRVILADVSGVICISSNKLPEVQEEDAGIDGWEI